jgi:hypothetical protein
MLKIEGQNVSLRSDSAMETALLLHAGRVILPLFGGLVLAQMMLREGYSLPRHPLSLLALGPGGWVQVANFLLSGALAVLFAVGLWQALAGAPRWIAVLVALHGAGLIVAGVFPADPAMGFPPGTPDGFQPASRTAALHGLGFAIAFSALTLACLGLAAAGVLRGPGIVVGLVMPLLIGLGIARPMIAGVPFFLAALLGFLWLFLLARDRLLGSG